MNYVLFYLLMVLLGWYVSNKLQFNKRELLELISLPIIIPILGTIVITIVTDITSVTNDMLLGLLFSPILLALIVALLYPLLLLPSLLILMLKEKYKHTPIVFFFFSALVGGLSLGMLSLELDVILTGMILSLLSVLIQYYYFDKKRSKC